jgi:hypothetical protein
MAAIDVLDLYLNESDTPTPSPTPEHAEQSQAISPPAEPVSVPSATEVDAMEKYESYLCVRVLTNFRFLLIGEEGKVVRAQETKDMRFGLYFSFPYLIARGTIRKTAIKDVEEKTKREWEKTSNNIPFRLNSSLLFSRHPSAYQQHRSVCQ